MPWRVGHKVPINVYDGDRPVCQCHNGKDAADIVNAMNYRRAEAAEKDLAEAKDELAEHESEKWCFNEAHRVLRISGESTAKQQERAEAAEKALAERDARVANLEYQLKSFHDKDFQMYEAAKARVKELERKCPECGGNGIEHSGVCHCGAEMEGHSLYDNHSAKEMTRPCQACTKSIQSRLAELVSAADVLKHYVNENVPLTKVDMDDLRALAAAVQKAREGSPPEK